MRTEPCNPAHTLRGGVMASRAGTPGAAMHLPEGAAGTTTPESRTNFIGPARQGRTVIAVATPLHIGRRTSIGQTRIATEAGKTVALVTQTQLVL